MRPDKSFYADLGASIRAIRKAKHISLRQLSEMTGGAYSIGTLSAYENGDPNIEKELAPICKALGVNADDVWDETEQMRYVLEDTQRDHDRAIDGLRKYWGQQVVELLRIYDSLNNEKKAQLLSYAEFLKSQQ